MDAAFIRPKGGFGDVLDITVAVRFFKEAHPDCEIDFFCPMPFAQVVANNPDIRAVYDTGPPAYLANMRKPMPRPWWRKFAWEDYDVAFEMFGPEMVVEKNTMPEIEMHRIEMWCNHVGVDYDGLTPPFYHVSKIERKIASMDWDEAGLPSPGERQVVGMQTASAYVVKDWPLEHFKELQRRFASEEILVCLFGKKGTSMWHNDDCASFRDCTFRESAALMERMDLMICPDSGYHHLAAALGIPQIALFGPTDAWLDWSGGPGADEFMHPIYNDCLVISKSANHRCTCWFKKEHECAWEGPQNRYRQMGMGKLQPARCMREISVDQVFEFAMVMLGRRQEFQYAAEVGASSERLA